LLIQEHDATVMQSSVNLPLHAKARAWIWDTVKAEGANLGTGFDLYSILADAGFAHCEIMVEAVVETPAQTSQTVNIVRALIPRIVKAEVATEEEIQVETLENRLIAERKEKNATFVKELVFGAIAHNGN
jgi:hypothetical protein